jgi:DNA invertase Pin-like site-specific DNA recombinase
MPTSPAFTAAEYVRMSTDQQRYSIDNQRTVIADYAEKRAMPIIRSYVDAGRSGLTADQRPALLDLMRDCQSAECPFNIVLVYDVSRWGRFQDADESAFYEHQMRRAGVVVAYCAEPFENDGSPVSTIVKSVKRAMAAEYSRELSAKVAAGQRRMAERGFRVGSHAGYGLRRMVVDKAGAPRSILAQGERKCLSDDRVILVPGPP